jgi:hypothetical protein
VGRVTRAYGDGSEVAEVLAELEEPEAIPNSGPISTAAFAINTPSTHPPTPRFRISLRAIALAALHGFVDLAFVIEALDTVFMCFSCETSVAVMESRLNLHHSRPKR